MARPAMHLLPTFCFILAGSAAFSQVVLPDWRRTDWARAGAPQGLTAPSTEAHIMDFGADASGTSPTDAAYAAAIASLGGAAGTVVFPEGTFLFQSTLTLPDSVFLQGQGAATVLRFELPGAGDLIRIAGTVGPVAAVLTEGAAKGQDILTVGDASGLSVGDAIRLVMDDADLVFSSWAIGTVGQVAEIASIEGTAVRISDPLNHAYPIGRNPRVHKLQARRGAGVECLRMERVGSAQAQSANILLRAAIGCAVRNVESYRCDFAHVDIRSSAHISVEGCYLNQAIGFGSGGQAYGTMVQEATSYCRVEDCIFDRLRHSMIAQSGANGNVFCFNYSRDPFWTDVSLPANSAGDLVMHGNYPYMNLAEGNTVQHMVVDASHGTNGPFNTFFRNRAQLYGFFSDSGTPTDSMNLIGNETTNMGFLMGNFIVNGNGHLSHGNNVRGNTTPAGTQDIGITSLVYATGPLPAYMGGTLPMVGYPLPMNANTAPAHARFQAGALTSCEAVIIDPTQSEDLSAGIPATSVCRTDGGWLLSGFRLPAHYIVYALDGRLTVSGTASEPLILHERTGQEPVLMRVIGADGTIVSVISHKSRW